MKTSHWIPLVLASGLGIRAGAQAILFDFENARVHAPLPISLTVDGLTADFSATGQGFSIQEAGTMGFTPAGFSGLCIYPSSVFAADLIVNFSRPVISFSILYSPQELGCDDSARMRVTAFKDGVSAGSATATAGSPGTWPTATLQIDLASGFNQVVVHYDARPPTCQDWGPIFLADNLSVTPAPVPPSLQVTRLPQQIRLSWPVSATGYGLQSNASPFDNHAWETVATVPEVIGDQNVVVLPTDSAARFFRLLRP